MLRNLASVSFIALALTLTAPAQVPTSDPDAVALAAKAVQAMTGGAAINDITLTGSAIWIAGGTKEVAPAILRAKGTGESRVDIDLKDGSLQEIRNDTGGLPTGSSLKEGKATVVALHNCWTDASWFFPALSSSLNVAEPKVFLNYVGLEKYAESSVHHLRSSRYLASKFPNTTALTLQLSKMDFYLDATTLLPVAITYRTHPDDDAFTDIFLEIRFSDYQAVNGTLIPFHIQKFISGGLALDVLVSSAAVNSGLTDTLF